MTEQPGARHRRRRRRAVSEQGAPVARRAGADAPPAPAPPPPGQAPPAPLPPGAGQPNAAPARRANEPAQRRPARARAHPDSEERGLRELIGSGHSQLGVDGALRGRDVNRPTEQDLAEAEQTVVIVRRHWQPGDRTPGAKK